MTNIATRAAARNDNPRPQIFDAPAERELRHTNRAARKIAERFALPIATAATIARLAGFSAGDAS